MAYELCFDTLPGFVHIKSVGEMSPHGIADMLSSLVSSPQWKKGIPMLIDYRNGSRDHFTYNDISMIADIICSFDSKLGGGKGAFLVNDSSELWIARMYRFICTGRIQKTIKVFQDFESAAAWLSE